MGKIIPKLGIKTDRPPPKLGVSSESDFCPIRAEVNPHLCPNWVQVILCEENWQAGQSYSTLLIFAFSPSAQFAKWLVREISLILFEHQFHWWLRTHSEHLKKKDFRFFVNTKDKGDQLFTIDRLCLNQYLIMKIFLPLKQQVQTME